MSLQIEFYCKFEFKKFMEFSNLEKNHLDNIEILLF